MIDFVRNPSGVKALSGDIEICKDSVALLRAWLSHGSNIAVYQNHDLSSSQIGHLKFLKVGGTAAFERAPQTLPDVGGWRYYHVATITKELAEGVFDEVTVKFYTNE